jgi:ribosomal protein S18 acetylase RimI-like enzyme
MKDVSHFIQITRVETQEHFLFNLYEFRFFRNSKLRSAMPLAIPRLADPFVIVAYVLLGEIAFFRKTRFFVMLKEHVAGTLILDEKSDSLYVHSLAVAPEMRRYGIATFALNYAEKLAETLGKERLELAVLKKNYPALRLYRKLGFVKKQERRLSFVLYKKLQRGDSHSPFSVRKS